MPELHPLVSFYAGDTFEIDGSIADKDGTALPLAGATIEWKLADMSRNVVLDYTVGAGIVVTDAVNGLIQITIPGGPNSDSAKLAPGRYRDQVRVTTSTGFLSTQWTGFIDVKQPL